MTKLSQSLKGEIHAVDPPRVKWSSASFRDAIQDIEEAASSQGLGRLPWLAIVAATTVTMGLPESVAVVTDYLVGSVQPSELPEAVEFTREVGLITLAMNGVCPLAQT